MYEYNCKIRRVVDGDCVGVTEVSDDGFESYSMYICLNQGWEQVL
jgi:hypothetical protein